MRASGGGGHRDDEGDIQICGLPMIDLLLRVGVTLLQLNGSRKSFIPNMMGLSKRHQAQCEHAEQTSNRNSP